MKERDYTNEIVWTEEDLKKLAPSDLEHVIVPEGVTVINVTDRKNIKNSDNIKKITFPKSLKIIENFVYCDNLEEIEIQNVIEICDNAFDGTFPKVDELILPEGLKSIGKCSFIFNSFKHVHLPSTLEYIGECAFLGCGKLDRITIPNKVKIVPSGCFDRTALTEVTLGENVEEIGERAFNRTKMKNITFPQSLKKIGKRAFYNVPLESIKLPEHIEEVGEDIFDNEYLTIKELVIPGSLKVVEHMIYGFSHNNKLERIYIEEGVEEITEGAFRSFGNLKKVILPQSLKHIKKEAFKDCKKLEEINMPPNLESIGENAFCGCGLKNITLPENLENISDGVFSQCSKLESVNLGTNLKVISKKAFEGCKSLKEIILPNQLKRISAEAFQNSGLESVTIPGTVKTISKAAFKDCKSLKTAIFEEGVRNINGEAFAGTAVEEITVHAGMNTIDITAFNKKIKMNAADNTNYEMTSSKEKKAKEKNLSADSSNYGLVASERKSYKAIKAKVLKTGRTYTYFTRTSLKVGDKALIGFHSFTPAWSSWYEIFDEIVFEVAKTSRNIAAIVDLNGNKVPKEDRVGLDMGFTNNVTKKVINDCEKFINIEESDLILISTNAEHTNDFLYFRPISRFAKRIVAAATVIAFKKYASEENITKANDILSTRHGFPMQIFDAKIFDPSYDDYWHTLELEDVYMEPDYESIKALKTVYGELIEKAPWLDDDEFPPLYRLKFKFGYGDDKNHKDDIDKIGYDALDEYINKSVFTSAMAVMIQADLKNLMEAFISANPPIDDYLDYMIEYANSLGAAEYVEMLKEVKK